MQNIVVFTGAGISAESGLGTFRDSGGLWEQFKIEDVATTEAFEKNPELYVEFSAFEIIANGEKLNARNSILYIFKTSWFCNKSNSVKYGLKYIDDLLI